MSLRPSTMLFLYRSHCYRCGLSAQMWPDDRREDNVSGSPACIQLSKGVSITSAGRRMVYPHGCCVSQRRLSRRSRDGQRASAARLMRALREIGVTPLSASSVRCARIPFPHRAEACAADRKRVYAASLPLIIRAPSGSRVPVPRLGECLALDPLTRIATGCATTERPVPE